MNQMVTVWLRFGQLARVYWFVTSLVFLDKLFTKSYAHAMGDGRSAMCRAILLRRAILLFGVQLK